MDLRVSHYHNMYINQDHITIWAIIKNAGYVAVFFASIEWIGFKPETLAIFTSLMLIDVVTGVMRSVMTKGGSTVKSQIFKEGILSKLLLLIALFSIGLAGKGIGFEMNGLVQACVSVLILSETYSILGNIHSILTGSEKVEFDAVAFFLSKIKGILSKIATK